MRDMAYFTTTDGCRLYHEIHGIDDSNPVVVFLNGTTQSALQWRPQALFLKNDFRVVCYDARAQGKSDLGDRALSLDLHVDDLCSLLAFLQIDNAHLVGLSHGARVALAFAARYSEKTARLILCSVGAEAGARTRAIIRSWRAILAESNLKAMAWAALPVIMGEIYLRANERILPKMVDALVARNRKQSLLAHLEALLTYPSPAVTAKKISRPTLVISGSEDMLNPPETAKQLAKITAGEHQAFEKIGHSLPVEATGRFNRACRGFLTQHSAI